MISPTNQPTPAVELVPELQVTPLVEMSRSLLGMSGFLDETAQAGALATPVEVDKQNRTVHMALLHMVARERTHERTKARAAALEQGEVEAVYPGWIKDWNTQWSFTPERQEHIRRKYPLAMRLLGRAAMYAVNARHMVNGFRYTDSTPMVDFATVMAGQQHTPQQVAIHLTHAGFCGRTQRHVSGRVGRPVPAEAVPYLNTFPLTAPAGPNSYTRRDIVRQLSSVVGRVSRTINQLDVYPTVHMIHTKQDRDAHEAEYFDGEAVAQIIQEFNPPLLDSNTEMAIAMLLRPENNRRTLYFAQKLLGIPEFKRQTPTNTVSRPTPCVPRNQQIHITRLAAELTKLRRQPPNPEAVRDAIQRAKEPRMRAKASRRTTAEAVQGSAATIQQRVPRAETIRHIANQPAVETLKFPQAARSTPPPVIERQRSQRTAKAPSSDQTKPQPTPKAPPAPEAPTFADWPDANDLASQLTSLFGTPVTKNDIREAAMQALDSEQQPTYDMRDGKVRVFSPKEAAAITIVLAQRD